MQYRDDEDVYSIGSIGIAVASTEVDTSSDVSLWVQQYTEWEAATPTRGYVPATRSLQELGSQALLNLPHLLPKHQGFTAVSDTHVAAVHA